MSTEELLAVITADTFTIHALTRRMQLVRDYCLAGFFSSSWETPKDASPEDAQWLAKFLRAKSESMLRGMTKETIADVFKALSEEVKKIPVLVLFLPISLPAEEIDNIGARMRDEYGKKFFIDIRVDPLLIAGAALAWKGIYKDYSVREKIRQHRQTIIEGFQKYIR